MVSLGLVLAGSQSNRNDLSVEVVCDPDPAWDPSHSIQKFLLI